MIKDENPDLIGLNEVYNDVNNIETVKQVEYIAEKLNYHYYYFGKAITIKNSIDYGNAVISKYPLQNFKIHSIDDPIIKDEKVYYETRSIIECEMLINNEIINIFVTHLGLANSEQTYGIKKLISLIKDFKTILIGDFNMEEDNDNMKLMSEYMENTSNLIIGNKFTYSSLKPMDKRDYIFVKRMKVKESYIVKKIASDHFPVVSVIDLY